MNRKEVETLIESLLVSFGIVFISVLASLRYEVCYNSLLVAGIFNIIAITYYRYKSKKKAESSMG